jgi:hypothetical protein
LSLKQESELKSEHFIAMLLFFLGQWRTLNADTSAFGEKFPVRFHTTVMAGPPYFGGVFYRLYRPLRHYTASTFLAHL